MYKFTTHHSNLQYKIYGGVRIVCIVVCSSLTETALDCDDLNFGGYLAAIFTVTDWTIETVEDELSH